MEKTIVVIGAGSSGLPSIKACKEEGVHVVCYEMTDSVGGIWKYREDVLEGVASVMKSTVINSSKEISAYSDFPPPDHFPNYMHNSVFVRYLELYAEKFDLVRHIKFRHKVTSVIPSNDYEETGRWLVTVEDIENNKIIQKVYDGVMAATGHHAYPLRPKFPGEEKFTGSIIHSHSYKIPNGYENKRVMVVGVGNSGGDLAVELSTVSNKVYLSTRRGCWVLNRVGGNGRPFDTKFLCRMFNLLFHVTPYSINCLAGETFINQRFDHAMYQLKPKHRIFGQHPMVNDALPNKILSGTVIVKGDIERFEKEGVVFKGEDSVTELDAVILATGYDIRFPYIPDAVLSIKNCMVELYKFVFPVNLKHPTLCTIGLIQPIGGLFPISELQARWFLQVITGYVFLPTTDDMRRDISETQEAMNKRYFYGSRHTIQVDYVDYLDDIASKIGAKPNLARMFFTDPYLFWLCFTGPSLPYQYRLEGPHAWPGARDAIIGFEERMKTPLQTRFDISGIMSPKAIKNADLIRSESN